MGNLLNEGEARGLVEKYLRMETSCPTTQEILNSGAIPKLTGYMVKPGKVSDSIHGSQGSFYDKTSGELIEYENPELTISGGTPLRVMVRTPGISTHDIVRGSIPFKDQILALNHHAMLDLFMDTLGTSQFNLEMGNSSVVIAAENLTQIPFENIIRAYMAKSETSTSLYSHYMEGKREFCGHTLPEGLLPNEVLPYVMDTPSTKSEVHDESVSPQFLFEQGICTPEQYSNIRNNSLVAFGMASQFLLDKGLILVDTKTEHGINQRGEIVVQDELYTMDSSRFWLLDDYREQLCSRIVGTVEEVSPKSFSKEFARGFSKGKEGYSDEERIAIAVRYIMGIQHLLGERFTPDLRRREERVVRGLETIAMRLD